MIARTTGWKTRLLAYLSEVNNSTFEPGKHDCALFPAGAIAAMTGIDPASNWRDAYDTLAGGMRLMKKEGFDDHIGLVASLFDEIPIAQARVGDLAVVQGDFGPSLGVVQGEMIYVVGMSGCGLVDLITASKAFRVPG